MEQIGNILNNSLSPAPSALPNPTGTVSSGTTTSSSFGWKTPPPTPSSSPRTPNENSLDEKTRKEISEEISSSKEKAKIYNNFSWEFHEQLKKADCWVAGGTITSIFSDLPINDFDIFFANEDNFNFINNYCKANFQEKFVSSNAITYSTNYKNQKRIYQLIRLPQTFKKSPHDLFECFDFTICMGAYDFRKGSFFFHSDFFKHLAQRKLSFNTSALYPICTVFRVNKFVKKGYRISKGELLKIMFTLNQVQFKTIKEVISQLEAVSAKSYHILNHLIHKKGLEEKEFDLNLLIDLIDECEQKYVSVEDFSKIDEDSASVPF